MLRRLAATAFCILLTGRGLAAEAGWEQELRQMGYLFLHLSNINVINGLNLTREQAVRLQGLARQIEQVAPQPPAFDAPVSPQIAEVRKAWLEMREVLLRGEDPSRELRDRAGRAFVAKSAFVRATVRPVPAAPNTQCASCHQEPAASKGLGFGPMTVGPALQRRVGLAHSQSLYGNHGLWKLALLARQADDLLTDGQKGILGTFSCCIAPPDDLSNPMRAGQADTNAKEMAILRRVRECTDGEWPWVRAAILLYVDPVAEAVSPGATRLEKASLRKLVAETIDKARAMSDVEFEMEKTALIKQVKDVLMPSQRDASGIKAAYFLLIPGASEVYAAYIKRLDGQ